MKANDRNRRRSKAILCLFAMTLCTVSAAQDTHPLITSKFSVSAGGYYPKRSLDVGARTKVGDFVDVIDFESDLGFDDDDRTFMAELTWQFGENWGLGTQFFRSGRKGSKALEKTIQWQDLLFNAGVNVDAATEFSLTRVFFARRFRDNGPHDLGLGAGFHWFDLETSLSGVAQLEDLTTEFKTSGVSASVPVPNVGVWYRYSASDRWMFSFRADWLSASVGDVSGRILNVSGGVNVSLFRNFGIGLNYQLFDLDASITDSLWKAKLVNHYEGPFLYISAYW